MRVLVIGLAGTGAVVVDDARARGDDVVVIEDHPGGEAYDQRARRARTLDAVVVEGPADADAAGFTEGVDLVVPSPGVRPDHPAVAAALARGVPVRSEIDVAMERIAARADAPRVIAVTGTNGKTTVTSMVAAMAEEGGMRSAAVGNIGRPLLDAVGDDVDVLVVEVSTFQLEFTTAAFAPDVAVLLNVGQDHIDWHGSVEAYAGAKGKVFAHQRPRQVLVANIDDPVVRSLVARAPGTIVSCSRADATAAFHLRGSTIVGPGLELATPTFRAPHDIDNALAAAAAATAVDVPQIAIGRTLAAWTPLPHRMQLVATIDGVEFVDDSKATNAHATTSVLGALHDVVLLAGGRDRSRDLGALRPYAEHLRAVVAIGEAASTIESVLGDAVPVVRAASMHDAVRAAAARARPGDTVLLSPACASLDWYSSYAERGDDFAREVASLRSGA
ncbi:MAG: UDP-N-acetylmuramoyl-L-alanine--D-glutamate ligase [Acidimicrobiia bacterium]